MKNQINNPQETDLKVENDRRIVKTKEAIKDQLVKLLDHNDVDQIRITNLTTLAQINRKTFYLHYKSVESVINEIENNFHKKLIDIINKNDIYPIELAKIKLYISEIINCLCNDKYMFALVKNEKFSFKLLNNIKKTLSENIAKVIIEKTNKREVLDSNEFKEFKERVLFIVKYHVFATVNMFYNMAIENTLTISYDELISKLANMIMRRARQN